MKYIRTTEAIIKDNVKKDESVCDARNFVDCRECPNHNNCQREKQLIQWWEQDMAMNEGGSLD